MVINKSYSISKLYEFEAAHVLDTSCASAECERMHGHSYKVDVTITGNALNDEEMLLNFNVLDGWLKPEIDRFDHNVLASQFQAQQENYVVDLNLPESHIVNRLVFAMLYNADRNTTAERMAEYFATLVANHLAVLPDHERFMLVRADVNETRKCKASVTIAVHREAD